MAILSILQNWINQQLWYYMYRLSSGSVPSLRTCDQLNGESLAGESSHRKVDYINCIGSYQIHYFNSRWNSFGETEERMKSRNLHCLFAKDIHIWHLGLILIARSDSQNPPNLQWRTLILPNFTKTPGIATSCFNLCWARFLGMLYQTLSYGGHTICYTPSWYKYLAACCAKPAIGSTHWHWMQLRRHCGEEIQLV